MDLPTCPTCGQSVLDDDATECPFCGSSMKPGTAPAKAPPKPAAAASAGKPAAGAAKPGGTASKTPPGGTKTVTTPAKAKSDDPFDVDQADTNAIQVSAKQTKTATMAIRCPMCDAAGFVPDSAVGKDVRCVNPKCIAPVFLIKRTVREADDHKPKEKPPRDMGKIYMYGGIAAGVLVFAGVIVFLVLAKQAANAPAEVSGEVPIYKGSPKTTIEPDVVRPDVTPVKVDLVALAIQELPKNAKIASAARKAVSRRLTATAFATVGNATGVERELQNMQTVDRDSRQFRVLPLALLAGKTGDDKYLTQALENSAALSSAPYKCEAAIELACQLAVRGKFSEAQTNISANVAVRRFDEWDDDFAAALAICRSRHNTNLDDLPSRGPSEWAAPLDVAVTAVLFNRGKSAVALDWAKQQTSSAKRAECLIAWAELTARDGLAAKVADAVDKALAVGAEFPPVEKARLYARVGLRQFAAGDLAGAEKSAAAALAATDGLMPPAAVIVADLKQLLALNEPDIRGLRLAAVACAETSALQLALKHPEQAAATLKKGLAHLAGIAPPMKIASDLKSQLASGSGAALVRVDFKENNDDRVQRRLIECRRAADLLVERATTRAEIQHTLLAGLTTMSQSAADIVLAEIEANRNEADPNLQINYDLTDLPLLLHWWYLKHGQDDLAKRATSNPGADQATSGLFRAGWFAEVGNPKGAADIYRTIAGDRSARLGALHIVAQAVQAGKNSEAVRFLLALSDLSLAEEGFRFAALAAASAGHADKFRAAALADINKSKQASLLVFMDVGLVEGLTPAAQP